MGAGRLRDRHHHSGPRSKYEANGYKPDFDQLPSEAEYRAAEEKDDDAKGA
jgi:hypothetical protein